MSDLQTLIQAYRDARTELRKALTEAFPAGSPVWIGSMNCYATVSHVDGEFIQLIFENGNIWPRQPADLTHACWDEMPLYWRRVLNPESRN